MVSVTAKLSEEYNAFDQSPAECTGSQRFFRPFGSDLNREVFKVVS